MSMKKSKGNMYDWVTHTHSHLRGKCSHNCGYCYVQAMAEKYKGVKEKYSKGEITIDEKELNVNYGKNNLIFIEHMNDLFAKDVPSDLIEMVLGHCREYPKSNYVFQTKNPLRYLEFAGLIPDGSICGTTIESNRRYEVMGKTPPPLDRITGIAAIKGHNFETFITIEPILDFDLIDFSLMLKAAMPSFINIGADSKGFGLSEPNYDKIMKLYALVVDEGIEVRKKLNLDRLKEKNENR